MEIGIIYENQSVYILHFDNLSKEYDREVDGTLSLVEHNYKRSNGKSIIERYITWKPNEDNLKNGHSITIDVEDLKSIKRTKMTVGSGNSYMIFFMRDGVTHPMMIFRDGGTKNLMDKLENYLSITKSNKERFLFLTEPRREEAVLQSFEKLDMFTNDKEMHASKFSRPTSYRKNVIWSGLANFGANITSQIMRNIPVDGDTFHIREMLREDAFGIPIEGHRLNTRADHESGFEIVSKPVKIELPEPSPIQRKNPLTELEWKKHLSPDGTVTCVEQLMEKIFKGGIEMSLRPVVWKYLLNYYKWDNSLEQNHEMSRMKSDIYHKMKLQWRSIFPEQEERFTQFRERKSIIEKDMLRTDRTLDFYSSEDGNLQLIYNILMTYSMFNFDLGYVQGMNDLLAPILFLMQDEVDAFWCFANLMDTLENNFSHEQLGIKKQFRQLYTLVQIFDPEFAEYLDNNGCREMLFCFRWLLVKFKRELSYENTMLLWEVLYTNYRCINFHLIFALAVLLNEKHRIMENNYGFNEILKHVNDLKLNDELETHLRHAESLYLQLDQIWSQIPEETRDILDLRLSSQISSFNSVNSGTLQPAKSGEAHQENFPNGKHGFKSVELEISPAIDEDSIVY